MNKGRLAFLSVILTLAFSISAYGEQAIEGTWLGTLEFQGVKLRVVFNIAKDSTGNLVATLDSPDQGAKGIPVDETSLQNSHLRLKINAIGGGYEGEVDPEYSEITGTWSQSGNALPLTLKRTDKVEEVVRPQDPKPPYPYDEREVSYENKKAGITLAGTLTLPRTGGPFPAALLITGSGAQDRNETIFGHHPFLVLADYLTRRGLAVLRVDDRGVGGSTGSMSNATSEDFVGDALAGVEYLKSLKEINQKQIGIIGHSEGGMIAPMAAAQSSDVAFIVMMAGPGVVGEELLYMQDSLILKVGGVSDSVINERQKINQAIFAALKANPDTAAATAALQKIIDNAIAGMTEQEQQEMQLTPASSEILISQLNSPWFRYFMAYDPKPVLAKVKCPVLAIGGELDLQVSPKANLSGISEDLKAGGNKDFTTKEMPGLNHLFQRAQTGSPMEYSSIEETISPDALKVMGDWIAVRTKGMK